MSRYPGGIIRATPVIPTTSSASGIWTLREAMQAKAQGIWPFVLALLSQATGTAIGGEGAVTNPGNAFDANETTYANGPDDTDAYVGKDWGVGVVKLIGRFIIKSPTGRSFSGGGGSITINWSLDGSDNGSAWTTIDSGTADDTGSTDQTTIDETVTPGSTSYRYHRVLISRGTISAWRIAELNFYELV